MAVVGGVTLDTEWGATRCRGRYAATVLWRATLLA